MSKMLCAVQILMLALILTFGAGVAQAQSEPQTLAQCAPREQVLATLSDRYGESRRAIGLAANATVMELFASETGSWTMTVTLPDGIVCLVASGEHFEAVQDPLPAKGDPA